MHCWPTQALTRRATSTACSPIRLGERWGRYWLDQARYADLQRLHA
ncbi:MAG: hypothetical protein U0935_20455 [Pirellulales bacterium]